MTRTLKSIEDWKRSGKLNNRYDMRQNEMIEIIENTVGGKWNIVFNFFVFGYMKGYRAATSEMKKKVKAV